MKLHDLTPNTPEWLEARAKWHTASEAPSMMGASPYRSRTALLIEKSTGQREVSKATQRIFDQGHESEERMRPAVESILGFTLTPETVTVDEGLLTLSATLDGYNKDASVVWEHKQANKDKQSFMFSTGQIPKQDFWQCVQQMYITGAKTLVYTCGNASEDLEMVKASREELEPHFVTLVNGWKQFDEDLKSFKPPEEDAKGETLNELPVLAIRAEGRVLASNATAFKAVVLNEIESINTDLQTPQDYADAAEAVKWCKSVEDSVKAGKEAVLAQTASIDGLLKELDEIAAHARRMRLYLDKEVKLKNNEKRNEIIEQAIDDLAGHCAKLGIDAPDIRKDIEAEMKGKRKLKSLIDAADKVLVQAKLAATEEYTALQDVHEWVLDVRLVFTRPRRENEATVLLRAQEAFKDIGTIIGINTIKEAA